MHYFALSVFPAPDSPEITIAYLVPEETSYFKAYAAIAYVCGSKDLKTS